MAYVKIYDVPKQLPPPDPLTYNRVVLEIGPSDEFYGEPDSEWMIGARCYVVQTAPRGLDSVTGEFIRCYVVFDPASIGGRARTIRGGHDLTAEAALCFASVKLGPVEPPDDPSWDDEE